MAALRPWVCPVRACSLVMFACLGVVPSAICLFSVVLMMFACCPILQGDLSKSWTFLCNQRAKDERLNQPKQRRARERHDQPEWHFLQLQETVATAWGGP